MNGRYNFLKIHKICILLKVSTLSVCMCTCKHIVIFTVLLISLQLITKLKFHCCLFVTLREQFMPFQSLREAEILQTFLICTVVSCNILRQGLNIVFLTKFSSASLKKYVVFLAFKIWQPKSDFFSGKQWRHLTPICPMQLIYNFIYNR